MNNDFVNDEGRFCALIEDLLAMARAGGADAAEADVMESAGMDVSVRRGALEGFDMNREQGLSLSVYVDGKSGYATTGTLTKQGLQTLAERALAIARATSSDPHAGLADAGLMASVFPELDLFHPWEVSPEDAIAIARRAEEASWGAHEAVSREKSDGAAVSSSVTLSAYGNTHGFCRAERTSAHSVSCSAIAERDGAMETDGWSESRRNAGWLPSAEEIGEKAGRFAGRRLGGGKVDDCRAGVLFQAPAAHSLIGHFVGAASGGSLYRNMSFLLDKLGSKVFAEHLSIRELPHLPGEFASCAFDDDGVATAARDVVRDGVWSGCFLSAYSARKLGMVSTGNAGGAHNLEVSSGAVVPAGELPAMLGRGLIVTDLMGQGVNMVTGDYSRGAAGFWVEDGEVVFPVSEVTIAGNLLSMLPAISAVGDDAMRRGRTLCGSVLIPDLIIGGNR